MKTRTHPLDYDRLGPIAPQLVHLCSACGGHMSMRLSDEIWYCVDCGGEDFEMVLDSEVEDYRAARRVSPWQDYDEQPDEAAIRADQENADADRMGEWAEMASLREFGVSI